MQQPTRMILFLLILTALSIYCSLFNCFIIKFLSFISFSLTLINFAWLLAALILKHCQSHLTSKNKIVLITGCDTGLGRMMALQLNANGFHVFAGCLSDHWDFENELKYPKTFNVIKLDVNNDNDIESAFDTIYKYKLKQGLKFWALINNAGIFSTACVEWGKLNTHLNVFNTNLIGTFKMTRKFLQLLRIDKGRIIMISSIASHLGLSMAPAYCMTKASINSLCNSLRKEAKVFDIKVTCIKPIMMDTPMTRTAIKQTFLQNWTETDPKIKSAYQNFSSKIYEALNTPRYFRSPSYVINSIYEALTSKEPETCILDGHFLTKYLFNLAQSLPSDLFEELVQLIVPV